MKQKVTLESRSESGWLEMFIQKLEMQVSMNLKETFENQSEGGYYEMFEKELDDVPDNLGEKQVSMNPKERLESQ